MCPTAIQPDQSTVLFLEKRVVFRPEDLTTQWFENDAFFGEGFDGFVEAHITSF